MRDTVYIQYQSYNQEDCVVPADAALLPLVLLSAVIVFISRRVYPMLKCQKIFAPTISFWIWESRTQKGDPAKAHNCFVNWSPDQPVSKRNNILSWRQTSGGRRGEEKGCGVQRGTKRPELLSPRLCHASAVFWEKSKILSQAINSHHSLISTSFFHPPPSKLSIQAIPIYALLCGPSPSSLPMLLLILFSQYFFFSVFRISHLLRPSSSASDLVCPPPAHRSTNPSNSRSICTGDVSRHHISFSLICMSLAACRHAPESSLLLSGWDRVSHPPLTLMRDEHDWPRRATGPFWVACQWNIYILLFFHYPRL